MFRNYFDALEIKCHLLYSKLKCLNFFTKIVLPHCTDVEDGLFAVYSYLFFFLKFQKYMYILQYINAFYLGV